MATRNSPNTLADLAKAGKKHITRQDFIEKLDEEEAPPKKPLRLVKKNKPKTETTADQTAIVPRKPGRPPGSVNKRTAELIDKLESLDDLSIKALRRIIRDKYSQPEHVLKAIGLAWAYRHGKPREQKDPDALGQELKGVIGIDGSEAPRYAIVAVGGNETEYVNSLRKLRGEGPVIEKDGKTVEI